MRASSLTRLDGLAGLADPLLPLPALTPERYAAGHAAFESRSDQRDRLADWLCQHLLAREGDVRVLSVGCGDGQLDAVLATAAATGDRDVVYDGLDPHPPSAGAFLARVGAIDGVTASAGVGRAESLVSGGYDIVLAVHSLYYVTDLSETVEQLCDALLPGGELVIALAPRAELNALAATLAPPVEGHRQWWAADLDAALDALDGLAVDRHRVEAVLDLEDCLDQGDPTGRAVLDFAVQAVLPPVLRDAVIDHLVSVRLDGQGLPIAHPVDLRVVRRT